MKETTVVHSEEKQGNSINVPPKAQQLVELITTQTTKIQTIQLTGLTVLRLDGAIIRALHDESSRSKGIPIVFIS